VEGKGKRRKGKGNRGEEQGAGRGGKGRLTLQLEQGYLLRALVMTSLVLRRVRNCPAIIIIITDWLRRSLTMTMMMMMMMTTMMMMILVTQTINEWLPAAEKQLGGFSPIAAEQRAVRIQIEQLKVRSSFFMNPFSCNQFTYRLALNSYFFTSCCTKCSKDNCPSVPDIVSWTVGKASSLWKVMIQQLPEVNFRMTWLCLE